MKYIKTTILLLLFAPLMVFAQDEVEVVEVIKENNSKEYLPKAGDISIGADALPYLEFLGNAFNGNTNNSLNLGETTLYFKYFLTDNTAVRAIIGIDNGTNNSREYVADDLLRLDPFNPNAKAEDLKLEKYRDVYLKVGYQIYKTRNRLAGYYGAQIGYGYGNSFSEYTYANPISAMNQIPTSHNFGGNINGASRVLEAKDVASNTISAGLFIGVEYFFMPKMSIGGEYGLDFQYEWSGQSNAVSESWNGSEVVNTNSLVLPTQSGSSFSTSRPATYGGLFLSFYF
ncbi:MAG TPA: hypothetical protein GX005_02735 [Bacteroidales bacterium]|nr:hypothetical protein [Bacteroidales bacterium]